MIMDKMDRVLALDVGDSRIGLALSDALGITAQPLMTLERKDGYQEKLLKLLSEKNIHRIVVGLPLELDGSQGPQAEKVLRFVKRLAHRIRCDLADHNISFFLVDERFSTAEAERVIVGSKLLNKERSAALDRISAAIILQTYLMTGGVASEYKVD